jgi:hypothetical protein
MRTSLKVLILGLFVGVVFGQVNNTWQGFQPKKRNVGTIPLPRPGNIIFKADLVNNITPSIGTAGSFARTGSVYYANSSTSLAVASGSIAAQPAFAYGGSGVGSGVQIAGARKNFITFSDDLSNAAWTTVGTLSVNNYAGTGSPDPGVPNSTQLTASSNTSGRKFDSGVLAANNTFIGSIYVRSVFGGNTSGKLSLLGTGGSEQVDTSFTTGTSTSVWTRVTVAKAFSGTAAGNASMQITIDSSSSTLFAVFAQIEQVNAASFVINRNAQPSPFIRTTGAVGTTNPDNLNYPSSNINPGLGTISAWVIPPCSNTDQAGSTGLYALSMNVNDVALVLSPTGVSGIYAGASFTGSTTYAINTPIHIAYGFDDANNLQAVYKNGVSVGTSAAAITAPVASTFNIGATTSLASQSAVDGPVSRVRIWNVKLSDTEVTQIFNSERGFYGI